MVCVDGGGVDRAGASISEDLGGRRIFFNKNFEDRRGEGFHENSNWS